MDLNAAVRLGTGEIENKAIAILNTVLLVMMTMEIVYTVALTLKSHALKAEPFLIIGVIAGIRRMLVITATSTAVEQPEEFHNMLLELGLLAVTVVALAGAIWGYFATARTGTPRGNRAKASQRPISPPL